MGCNSTTRPHSKGVVAQPQLPSLLPESMQSLLAAYEIGSLTNIDCITYLSTFQGGVDGIIFFQVPSCYTSWVGETQTSRPKAGSRVGLGAISYRYLYYRSTYGA